MIYSFWRGHCETQEEFLEEVNRCMVFHGFPPMLTSHRIEEAYIAYGWFRVHLSKEAK